MKISRVAILIQQKKIYTPNQFNINTAM